MREVPHYTTTGQMLSIGGERAEQLAVAVLESNLHGTRCQGKPKRQRLNDIEQWLVSN